MRPARDPDRGHAQRGRRSQVLRHVLDHRGAGGGDAVALDQHAIAAGIGLGQVIARDDVVDHAEGLAEAEIIEHALGMAHGGVGEDELAPGQRRDRRAKPRIARQHRQVELVHIVEEALRRQAIVQHEAAQRRAVELEEAPAQSLRRVEVELQLGHDEVVHPRLDLAIEAGGRGIERVVEIEDPGLDLIKCARWPRHGS